MADIDPKVVIDEALAATQGLFTERSVRLETDFPADLPEVHVDADRLMQVVVNLISNAVKFCDAEAGVVSVGVLATGHHLRVDVHDNGPGLVPTERTLIFERFHQATDTLTDKPRGTGLGLPICRQIIDYFGGRIWADSAPGAGATFSFTMPIAQTARQSPPESDAAE